MDRSQAAYFPVGRLAANTVPPLKGVCPYLHPLRGGRVVVKESLPRREPPAESLMVKSQLREEERRGSSKQRELLVQRP